jgi:ATP-dependent Clp protease adaptor protein ClpS
MFRVVLHNDDYTTQEFVIDLLIRHFRKEFTEAWELMQQAHASGSAVVGVYTRDIAETRIEEALEHARKEGHPLLLTAEPQA